MKKLNQMNSMSDLSVTKKEAPLLFVDNEGQSRAPLLISIAMFLLIGTFMPILNKFLFHGVASSGDVDGSTVVEKGVFPYPLTTTMLQFVVSAGVLTLFSFVIFKVMEGRDQVQSWMFGGGHSSILWKFKSVLFAALAFTTNVVLSNVSLSAVNINVHVFFRSAEILWVVLFAYLMHQQKPNLWTILCCFVVLVGTVLLTVHIGSTSSASALIPPVVAIVINILAVIAAGLSYVLIRDVVLRFKSHDQSIGIVEIAGLKMMIGALVMIVVSLALETDGWIALGKVDIGTSFLLLSSEIITLGFSLANVAVATYTHAITAGVLAQSNNLPTFLLTSLIFGGTSVLDVASIIGIVLVTLGTLAYGILMYKRMKTEESKPWWELQNDEYRAFTDLT